MTSNLMLTALAAATVLASGSALAARESAGVDAANGRAGQDRCASGVRAESRHHGHDRHAAGAKHALHEVPNGSAPDEASYGWQYFSNARTKAAVVISPAGEYFLSRGDGLRQITGPAGDLLTASAVRD